MRRFFLAVFLQFENHLLLKKPGVKCYFVEMKSFMWCNEIY